MKSSWLIFYFSIHNRKQQEKPRPGNKQRRRAWDKGPRLDTNPIGLNQPPCHLRYDTILPASQGNLSGPLHAPAGIVCAETCWSSSEEAQKTSCEIQKLREWPAWYTGSLLEWSLPSVEFLFFLLIPELALLSFLYPFLSESTLFPLVSKLELFIHTM